MATCINMTTVAPSSIHIDMDTDDQIDLTTKSGRLKWARVKAGFRSARSAGQAMNLKASTYPAHENGQNQFHDESAQLYGKTFDVSWLWLLHGTGTAEPTAEDRALYATLEGTGAVSTKPPAQPRANASFPPRFQKFPDETIPVMGQTVGGPNGRFILNGQEVSRVFCPPDLAGVDGAYAVQVYGTSMEPKFEAGETVWLHPYAPVRTGDYVVAQVLTQDEEPPESYIKQFVSKSSKVLRLRQFNPEEGETAEIEFPADKVFSVHKIVFHALV
jgi:phage repressor protein C with HTH and peptisase S24 domain